MSITTTPLTEFVVAGLVNKGYCLAKPLEPQLGWDYLISEPGASAQWRRIAIKYAIPSDGCYAIPPAPEAELIAAAYLPTASIWLAPQGAQDTRDSRVVLLVPGAINMGPILLGDRRERLKRMLPLSLVGVDPPMANVIELYVQGMSLAKLAKLNGIKYGTLLERLETVIRRLEARWREGWLAEPKAPGNSRG